MESGRFPVPSLARAARDLRAAREVLSAGIPDTSGHQAALLDLRHALRVYLQTLERDGLPVASKLQRELTLLDIISENRPYA